MKPLHSRLFALATALCAFASAASAQDWAKPRLEKTTRHYEYVKVMNGAREVTAFITYPEVKNKATALVLIHDNQGLTDWARGMTDQGAEAGYITIAPDLLSGMGPKGGGTSDFGGDRDAVAKGFSALGQKPDQITSDLNAIVAYVAKLPACNGKVVVGGFCWGGGQTFRYATNNKEIKAALVFYGPSPKEEDIGRISAPVYGFYGGTDARINASLPKTQELMKAGGKAFEPVTYEGAGHGFMKSGEDPAGSPENKQAREAAWKRLKEILAKL
ncbi:MAG: dienelactone hydrolase family protein [Verrucomicrobia bacterium]|nr:dienelactone hydrolase family protein [Verrucomicrobiota bacterium]